MVVVCRLKEKELSRLRHDWVLAYEAPVFSLWHSALRAEWWCGWRKTTWSRGSKTRWVAPPSNSTGNPTFRVPRKVPPRNQGTPPPVPVAGGDMSLLISFLQTIGLPQEVMSQVESKLAPPRQKEITDEKALALAKAKLDRVVAQKNKLNQTGLYHTAKLRERRLVASNKRFSPTQSVAASVDPEPHTDGMSQDGAPAQRDALGVVGETTAPDPEPQVRFDVAEVRGDVARHFRHHCRMTRIMMRTGHRIKKRMTNVSSSVPHLLGNDDGPGWVLVRTRARKGKKKEKVIFCTNVLSGTSNSVFSSSLFKPPHLWVLSRMWCPSVVLDRRCDKLGLRIRLLACRCMILRVLSMCPTVRVSGVRLLAWLCMILRVLCSSPLVQRD